ncbi:ATP-dependent DNA helicase [Allobranchiibius sp. GilTou38]|uniref:ATP-dependent helicase n=1 Tax=Allobranchiibius sp. GilTou38 TaxID=2815210 RepID=UPI001AA12ACC|nr:ATP-dependent DNA helicase [Allobranchiibius sp. GilTou38]MBO1765827.1 ATP-dependent helicase [Allobranchiibius sp. GilTou38]
MRRAAVSAADRPALDDVQEQVVRGTERSLVVLGAPGTGKSTVAIETVVAAVEGGLAPDECLLLAPTRVQAAALRDRLTARLQATSTEPVARTHQSLAFGMLREAAALHGEPAPRLLSGPEQDVVLRELLAGHAAGDGDAPQWPDFVREALPTRGFRAELRDLLMRAVEWGLDGEALRELGVRHERPAWVAAAQVLDEYDRVTALSRPGAYDPSWILGAAATLLDTDAEAAARLRRRTRLVVVDDAQELTHASASLLDAIAHPGARLVLLGDPDSTVQGFRGADPRYLRMLAERRGAPDPVVLPRSYRVGPRIGAATGRVAERIGTVGAGLQRAAAPVQRVDHVEVALLRATSQEAAYVAARLRECHLMEGVPWSQMAVIVRGQARAVALRRAFAGSGVPVAVPATTLPVRDEPAVRPFLLLLETAIALVDGQPHPITPEAAVDLLTSPLGGADAIELRRMRRVMRATELDDGGSRSSDELLAAAVVSSGPLDEPELAPAARIARVLRAGLTAGEQPAASAETVLWAMWLASGLANQWRDAALAGGASGTRADRDLDAMMALFAAAAAYDDRLPGSAPAGFLEHIRGQDVPGDRIVPAAPEDGSVALITPAAAAGRQWRVVAVCGVQEGVWPDLRLRGSLLGSEALVDVMRGREARLESAELLRAAQAAVRYDETRQFHVAVSRASERLLVTAVRSDDEQPSAYLDLIDPTQQDGDGTASEARQPVGVPVALTLTGTVAALRREIVTGSPAAADRAADELAYLAAQHVPGADPAQWWALTQLSDDRPVRAADAEVPVSPSRVESFGTCGLNWLLTSAGGDGPDLGTRNLGTLVHEIAAEFPDADLDTMTAELDERWARLGYGDTWMSERDRVRAHRMLAYLHDYFEKAAAQGWKQAGVEVRMDVVVGRARLRGSADRLESQEGDAGIRIVDFKTGSSKPKNPDVEENPQLGVYQVAVIEGGFDAGDRTAGAQLVHLGTAAGRKSFLPQPQSPLDTAERRSWAYDLLARTAEGMSAAHVTATLNDRCRTCPVRGCCPLQEEGRRLGGDQA